jgi:hypothetical protein
VLRLCIDTPYRSLRAALHEAFPEGEGRRGHSRRSNEKLRRTGERHVVEVIVENENGMVGNPALFRANTGSMLRINCEPEKCLRSP